MIDMDPLNSPLEVGIRALVVLSEIYPDRLDIGKLVYYDHALLHSGDLGGPPSLHPNLPARPGEFGVKRGLITDGLHVMLRANLASIKAAATGLTYSATEESAGFISILESPYTIELRRRAEWIATSIHPLQDEDLYRAMVNVFERWSEEFSNLRRTGTSGSEET